ncbi:DUF2235 domain-containing protein [Caballeronia novacaledonica]|uniref:DUF2235 domain-containing protein n=1 Tax=Caballeronia novacaledonica TaxID=1544861 RepID=A0AA37MR33_9BURK|nr:DUF2235 domain-containing protein [Caballeronia novacaledonica]GJH27481.1 DUF2235 domain-containing protein [Caballeronia novacaledonica]
MTSIVVLSDGTGNSSAKAQKTNVWRMFQALDQSASDQIAFYDDGVGTSANKYLALAGGAFGWGLKRNVIDLYKFVCRNYRPGDDISGFGFSRGAFTIRVLVGLIDSEGLLEPTSEEDLDRDARRAYRHYRSARFPSKSPLVWGLRALRDGLLWASDRVRRRPLYAQVAKRKQIPIRFLGLWDTVSAYGVPILPLKRAIDATIWPMMFGDLKLSPHVKRACHALSLDDERSTFHPLPWDETGEPQTGDAHGGIQPGRITQVWFPGVHCNVGGGYPEDQLSLVSLHWILNEAIAVGIRVLPSALSDIVATQSPFARVYDSRKGLAGGYPYLPRLALPCVTKDGKPFWPIVHWSVPVRVAFGTDRYAPVALRESFQVLMPDGTLEAVPANPGIAAPPLLRPAQAATRPTGEAAARLKENETTLRRALASLKERDTAAMGLAWDTVFWRRAAYLATLILSALLILFPWFTIGIEWLEKWHNGALSVSNPAQLEDDMFNTALTFIKGMLPSWSSPWTSAFGAHSSVFVLTLLVWLGSLQFGGVLRKRVHDRAFLAWHPKLCLTYLEWRRLSEAGSRNMTLAGAALFALLAAFAWGTLKNQRTSWELTGAAVALCALALWRQARVRRLDRNHRAVNQRDATPAAIAQAMKGGFALSLARRLRDNGAFGYVCKKIECVILPGLCLAFVGLLGIAVANRALFDGLSAVGKVCAIQKAGDTAADPAKPMGVAFHTKDLCWDSGVTLDKDARYEIRLVTDGDWLDRTERADVGGFPTDTAAHFAAAGLKRWWFEDWFKPIARIGEKGHDEYVLEPEAPFASYRYANNHRAGGVIAASSKPPLCDVDGGHLEPLGAQQAACVVGGDPTPAGRKVLVSQITAKSSGRLFLYVNDAVAPIGFDKGRFYPNNLGCAQVIVSQVMDDRTRKLVGQSLPCSTALPAANAIVQNTPPSR